MPLFFGVRPMLFDLFSSASKYGTDVFSSQNSLLAQQDSAFSDSALTMSNIGAGLQVAGVIQGMVGGFYAAKNQAASLKFQSDMSAINARMAEKSAQSILDQGQRQVGQLTMRAGQLKSSQRAAMAANGVDLGEGSAAEIQASTDIMKDMDALMISANAIRSASAARTQSVNASNQSLLQRTTANSISPFSAAGSSLLSGATSVASTWFKDRALEKLLAGKG